MMRQKRLMGVLFIKDPFTNLARFQQIWSCQNQKLHHCMQQAFLRLELLSAVLGLRFAKMLADAFQLSMDVVIFWCNRMNLLWWIQGRFNQFNQ